MESTAGAEQSRAEQSRAEQSRAEQSRAEQSISSLLGAFKGGGVQVVRADARFLLGQCADLAKGARFYADNFSCNEFQNGDRQQIFLSACMGVLAFCLDAIDEHFCALDEAGQYRKGMAELEARIDYSKRDFQ